MSLKKHDEAGRTPLQHAVHLFIGRCSHPD